MSKKTKYFIVAASLFVLVGLGVSKGYLQQVWAAIDPTMLPTILRTHVVASDIDGTTLSDSVEKANVLFLVDTGNSMVFSPKGKMPQYQEVYDSTSGTAAVKQAAADAAAVPLVKECTFGIGARPALDGGSYYSRAGRDVDSTNNEVGSADCYYITSSDNNLTYQNGVSGALMPNDSRMYKMKLVFWRMLQDQNLFEKLRFGLATTHVSQTTNNGVHVFYKTQGNNNWDAIAPYTHGTIYLPYTRLSSTTYNQVTRWAISTTAINTPYSTSVTGTGTMWHTVHRGFLRVPFGENTAGHLRKFRTLINGIENNTATNPNTNPDFNFVDPELTTSGAANLATAIYPRNNAAKDIRDEYIERNLVYYSVSNDVLTVNQNDGMSGVHKFAKNSGEATGTVLDFFSPPVSGKGASATAMGTNNGSPLKASKVSFPIRNRCEPNWLIIFTSGDGSSGYTSAEAVRDLYDYTKKANSVVMLSGDLDPSKSANLGAITLAQPIRTMVIGFADPNSSDDNVKKLVENLNKMADYGDDGKLTTPPSATAYFANDVPGLLNAMRQILVKINAEIQGSAAPMMVNPQVEEDTDAAEAYSPNYKRQGADQWKGFFTRFDVEFNASGDIDKLTKDWEFGNLLTGYTSTDLGGRRLTTWDYRSTASDIGNLKNIPLPGLVNTAHTLAPLMGLETSKLAGYTASTPHPSNLMLRWMHGEDYSYTKTGNKSTLRETQFSDMGNSGYVLVGRVLAASVHDQPGYQTWVSSNAIANRKRTLYLHSNGGMLHALDVASTPTNSRWGRERWAFIPPNILSNQRLAGLKFNFSVSGTTQQATWMNSEAGSNAAFLLDGTVRTQNLPTGANWDTYLFGSLGRGGAGLYAMQITNPELPKFLWAMENNPYSFNTNSSKGRVHFWSSAPTNSYTETSFNNLTGNLTPETRDYRRMGIAAPTPAIASTLLGSTPTNVGILSGGMQYDLNLAQNGTIGSAIYLFNPVTGDMIKQFNPTTTIKWASAAATSGAGADPQMGMVLTPPTLVTKPTSQRYLEGFFTADNRGNIFEGRFVDDANNGIFYTSTNSWTLTRVASLKNTAETTSSANYVIAHEMSVARAPDRNLWVFGGTSDLSGRNIGEDITSKVAKPISGSSIVNSSQWLFGFRNPDRQTGSTLLLREASSPVGLLNAELSADKIDVKTKSGWRIALRVATPPDAREYLSAPTLLYGDYLVASTFIPLGSATADCTMDGNSRLYLLDALTGKGEWPKSDKKYLSLTGIKIAGLTVSHVGNKPRLFLSISILNSTGFDLATPNSKRTDGDYGKTDAILHTGTLLSIELPAQTPIGSGGEKLNYWREVFNAR